MFDLVALLTHRPLPRGDSVAIVNNAGGLAHRCADACDAARLRVATLGKPAQRELAAQLSPGSAVMIPVDMTAAATATNYERAITTELGDPGVDAVIALFARSLGTRAGRRRRRGRARRLRRRPVLSVFVGSRPSLRAAAVSRFAAPEEAVRALGRAVTHARRRAEPPDPCLPWRAWTPPRGGHVVTGRRRRFASLSPGRGAAELLRRAGRRSRVAP